MFAAALVLAACSESTGPDGSPDTRYAKPAPPPTGPSVAGTLTNATYTFEDLSITGASGTSWAIDDLEDGGFSAAAPSVVSAWNNSTRFLGRIDNHALFLIVPNAGSEWSLAFDLYIIGSWDGQGQQAQQGSFGQDIWRLGIRCTISGGLVQDILTTDFSNQLTVQQSYPMTARKTGGNRAGEGSYGQDLLGFRNDPSVHTPQFRSFGDTEYHMSFSGTNPCAPGQGMIFSFIVPDAGLQSNYDESWGVDNVVIKTDA